MADEITPILNTDIAASQTAPTSEPKKQRKPRTKKTVAETAAAEVSGEPSTASGAVVVKRGRQTRARKTDLKPVGASSVRKNTRKVAVKPAELVAGSEVVAIDGLVDLLQLEQENQRLRKLLAEKLRGENADLRKKLGLG